MRTKARVGIYRYGLFWFEWRYFGLGGFDRNLSASASAPSYLLVEAGTELGVISASTMPIAH